jgi:hypothetical protein
MTKFAMETANIPVNKESLHAEITNEDNTYLSLSLISRVMFTSQGQTVNQAYFVEILKQLREAVCTKRPELWHNDWILQAVSSQKINY